MQETSPNFDSSQPSAKIDGQLKAQVEKLKQEVFKPEVPPERKLPWFIDIFLYPFSIAGTIHLIIFLLGPLLIQKLILHFIDFAFGLITLVCYILFIGYFFYYISHCIFDSSKGGLRAPDVTVYDVPEKGELVSQIFLMFGAVAVCLFPAMAYFIITEQTGTLFRLLLAAGVFSLPITLLVAALFDSVEALSPILIFKSIYRTFLPYLGLVLIFSLIAWPVSRIISGLPKPQGELGAFFYISSVLDYLLGMTFILYKIAFIYLTMVSAHLLGRFYFRYKAKLDWGI
jgi:hypothetical protein